MSFRAASFTSLSDTSASKRLVRASLSSGVSRGSDERKWRTACMASVRLLRSLRSAKRVWARCSASALARCSSVAVKPKRRARSVSPITARNEPRMLSSLQPNDRLKASFVWATRKLPVRAEALSTGEGLICLRAVSRSLSMAVMRFSMYPSRT